MGALPAEHLPSFRIAIMEQRLARTVNIQKRVLTVLDFPPIFQDPYTILTPFNPDQQDFLLFAEHNG